MKKPDNELKTPPYVRKSIKRYESERVEFRKRVFKDEFEKLLAYWKELISSRKK